MKINDLVLCSVSNSVRICKCVRIENTVVFLVPAEKKISALAIKRDVKECLLLEDIVKKYGRNYVKSN